MNKQTIDLKDKVCMQRVAQTLLNFNNRENSEEITKAIEYLCTKFEFKVIG